MQEKNIVIGIEGLVGAGKTSISREMLNYVPNSILLHGGDIYRAIVSSIIEYRSNTNNLSKEMKNIDITEIMKKLKLDIKVENRETVVYINGEKVKNEKMHSEVASIAVSTVSNVADNTKLYEFGSNLIDKFRKEYNVILSSRDIIKMYPKVTYHFFITADLQERINRKYIQYKGELSKDRIKKMIEERDNLQEKTGYYKIYDQTIVVDVTESKSIEQSCKQVMQYIKIPANLH